MKEEWVKNLLGEAQSILDSPVIYKSIDALEGAPLEEQCSFLLSAFSRSADLKFFEGVYKPVLLRLACFL